MCLRKTASRKRAGKKNLHTVQLFQRQVFNTDCNMDMNAGGAETFSIKMGTLDQGHAVSGDLLYFSSLVYFVYQKELEILCEEFMNHKFWSMFSQHYRMKEEILLSSQ